MSYAQTPPDPRLNSAVGGMGRTALTWVNLPAGPRAYRYVRGVKLWERDLSILEGVASFGAMTTGQIRELYFHGLKSPTSCKVVLRRLVENGALSRVHVNMPENVRGGSPTGCYQIGKTTWKSMYGNTSYKPIRDQYKLMHTLFVVEVFLAIKRLERTGALKVEDVAVESDAWASMGGHEVHPDIDLRINAINRGEPLALWVEVDRSNEYERQIQDKIHRYIGAYQSEDYQADPHRVVFVARGEDRVKTLKRYIRKVSDLPRGLFVVFTLDDFVEMLGRERSS